jgi:hypothetical protein
MPNSIRIICAYNQEKITVTSKERIEMLAQTSDPLDGFDNLIGFWLELRSVSGKVLYRQIMRDPFQPDVEYFNLPDQRGDTFAMTPRKEVTGHLVLLVPDEPEADHVALVRSVPDPKTQKLNVSDVVRISVQINQEKQP